jgi:hypothetical protein
MSTPLFILALNRKRDIVRARQLVRQAASLLGFGAAEQRCIAAAAFDLACQAHECNGRANMTCEIVDSRLQVVCTSHQKKAHQKKESIVHCQRLAKDLPAGAPASLDDVPFVLQRIAELAPLNLFEELKLTNQELLQTLLDKQCPMSDTRCPMSINESGNAA